MIARAYQPADEQGLKDLLKGDLGDLAPGRDSVVVVENGGRIVGVLGMRSVTLVHEFAIEESPMARHVAACLMNYGLGALKAMGAPEAMFVVDGDNDAMRRFVLENNAVREDPGDIYTLQVR